MLFSLHIGPEKNFCYLILCAQTGEAALVDPAFEPQRVYRWVLQVAGEHGLGTDNLSEGLPEASPKASIADSIPPAVAASAHSPQLRVKYLIATHGHRDHAGGFGLLAPFFPGVQIVCGKGDEGRLLQYGFSANQLAMDGDVIGVGKIDFRVMHTPGHTPGGCCFFAAGTHPKIVLTGDTLFIDQCGRTDLPGGSDQELFESLQRLKTLPRDTVVYPGHDYGPTPNATIGSQMETNPTLRAPDFETFRNLP